MAGRLRDAETTPGLVRLRPDRAAGAGVHDSLGVAGVFFDKGRSNSSSRCV